MAELWAVLLFWRWFLVHYFSHARLRNDGRELGGGTLRRRMNLCTTLICKHCPYLRLAISIDNNCCSLHSLFNFDGDYANVDFVVVVGMLHRPDDGCYMHRREQQTMQIFHRVDCVLCWTTARMPVVVLAITANVCCQHNIHIGTPDQPDFRMCPKHANQFSCIGIHL